MQFYFQPHLHLFLQLKFTILVLITIHIQASPSPYNMKIASIALSLALVSSTVAFTPSAVAPSMLVAQNTHLNSFSTFTRGPTKVNTILYETVDASESSEVLPPAEPVKSKPLSDEELGIISEIAKKEANELSSFLLSKISQMPPNTILTLRNASQEDFLDEVTDEQKKDLKIVGDALVEIMDETLKSGRDLLQTFLQCGEIRKLDGAIGKANKEGKLDMGFFTVLSMNIRDATIEARENGESTVASEEGQMGSGENPGRLQILQHIYTRCQEEVEKVVSPGVGLLNKLLRTEQSSIRANQLSHYLCPQAPKTIKSPDGKEVELAGSKALVNPSEFIEALQNSVKQIRTIEKSGGADKAAAAGLVESCRQVAIEARLAIGEGYGVESEELKEFELALQPVFRPETPESEYIKGL